MTILNTCFGEPDSEQLKPFPRSIGETALGTAGGDSIKTVIYRTNRRTRVDTIHMNARMQHHDRKKNTG
jgi:hypothetical protein